MSVLPVSVEINPVTEAVVIYAHEQDAIWAVCQAVAKNVPPMVIANIARASHEFHENGGISAAAALDSACEDIPDRLNIELLRLSGDEAIALGAALQRLGQHLLLGGDAA